MRKTQRQKRYKRILLVCCASIAAFIAFYCLGHLPEYAVPDSVAESYYVADLSDEVIKGEIPCFYQNDARWKNITYGADSMEITGCGPTCLSMVLCGLRGDAVWPPVSVARYAQKQGYYVEGSGSAWTLMSEGASHLGLNARELPLDEERIRQELRNSHPIICIMGAGDFTTTGHYIVLVRENADGSIRIHDPNSHEHTNASWNLARLMEQMKNLWSYTLQ